MQFDFAKTMKQASNAELIKIVTASRNDYQKDAIIAAEAELAIRNLTSSQVEEAKSHILIQQQMDTFKANTPLDVHWKILTFIFPAFLQLILSGIFKSEGYDRKANELVKWTLYGFAFYIGIIILIVVS